MEQTSVDLTALWQIVIPLAVAVLTALASWLSIQVTSYFKLKSDNVVRGYLDEILKRGIGFAQSEMEQAAARYTKVDVKNAVVASAAAYAIRQAPDAITRFGLTPAQVEAMVSARLAKLPATDAVITVVATNDNASKAGNDNASRAGGDILAGVDPQ